MTSAVASIVVLLVAWNPAVIAERAPAMSSRRWIGSGLAAAAWLAVATATSAILSGLDVAEPTFRTAAGAVVAITGARWLAGTRPMPDAGEPIVAGVVDVATPAVLFAAMAATISSGWWSALIGVAVAAAATAALQRVPLPAPVTAWLRRLLAGIAVAVGVALIYAGIRAV